MAQDDKKKFSLVHFISQEPYIIWLSFMVHFCKMMISPGVFFFFFHFFKILILWVVRGCKWAKNDPKWEKILSVVVLISGIIHHMIFIMVLMLKMIIPRSFFYFSKILIFWVVGRVQGQKWPKMARNSVFCTLYIRNHTSYDLDIWYTCVKG